MLLPGPAVLGIAALLILAALLRAEVTKRNLVLLVIGCLLIVLVVRFSVQITMLTHEVLHLMHLPL